MTFCRRARSIESASTVQRGTLRRGSTHITGKVLLLAQDGLISIELAFKLADQLLHVLLIRYFPIEFLEYLLVANSRHDRIKIRILDAGRLLEFGTGLALGRNQLWAGADACEVASDSARLVQLEPVSLLNYEENCA